MLWRAHAMLHAYNPSPAPTASTSMRRPPTSQRVATGERWLGCGGTRLRPRESTPLCRLNAAMRDGACASSPYTGLSGVLDVDGRIRAQEMLAQHLPRPLATG